MFRVKIKGDPKSIVEFLNDLRGVDAEVYVSVNDPNIIVELLQKALEKQLTMEITPYQTGGGSISVAPAILSPRRKHNERQSSDNSSSVSKQTTKPAEKTVEETDVESSILKKYTRKKKTSRPKVTEEKSSGKGEETSEKKIHDKEKSSSSETKPAVSSITTSSIDGGKEKQITQLTKAMKEADEEISFDELMRLKEEAFSRKFIE